ncbi:G-protein coupled receptor, putative [Plasmodium gallinaceum]|uniref:G-protein coupled receptor, putative n=1 Tax=Plasmodium gallinaceum TaxID=5849 RepID=A0A1J1GP17_PLAGA|nr:G-protein coupled receptor, putative [Plasmodium gallinaceum]CRG93023.1 G-protein coupled receptor, putative [Plasmodium gallinaceum]
MADDNRYISNKYLEEFEENELNLNIIKKKIIEFSLKLNNEIENHRNYSVYCGVGGILYMNIILYECSKDVKYLELGKNIIRYLNNHKQKNTITFLEGITGIYSLSSMLYHYLENKKSFSYIELLVNHLRYNKDELRSVNEECELLYGKCGYIYSFLFCRNVWLNSIYKNTILKNLYFIMNSIFEYGLTKCTNMRNITSLSLYFEWHGKIYLGAAHGYAGILFVLFNLIIFFLDHINELCLSLIGENNDIGEDGRKEKLEKCKDLTTDKLNNYIKLIYKVTDEILSLYVTDDFNVYSSIRKEKIQKKKEILIQWCHGNPGFIILLIELLKYEKVPNYFQNKYSNQFIEKMGLLIWEKGLLSKGLGLCHGISGNGIIFLYLYNYTKDKIWYIRSLKYALFSIKFFDRFYNLPDRPDSLFEGYAALVVFLSFILKPELNYFLGHDFSKFLVND